MSKNHATDHAPFVTFIPDAEMSAIAKKYRRAPRQYAGLLPVAVGQVHLSAEEMHPGGRIRGDEIATVYSSDNPKHADLHHITQEVVNLAPNKLKKGHKFHLTAEVLAKIYLSIRAFDEKHFGTTAKVAYYVTADQQPVTHSSVRNDDWHPDGLGTSKDRIYVIRINAMTEFVRNADRPRLVAEGALPSSWRSFNSRVEREHLASVIKRRRLSFQPKSGQIMLMNGGKEGTLHRSYRPPKGCTPIASTFLRVWVTHPA